MNCYLCNSSSFLNRKGSVRDSTDLKILECKNCGLVTLNSKSHIHKEFYRNSGCIIISNGCPCPPIAVDEIVSGPTPPVILAPGSVSNITVEYGSVIVRWNAPTEGGAPTSYTVFADDQTNSANSVTITGIPSTIYTFPTYTGPAVDQLTAGDEYLFSVTAVNSAGSGAAEVSSSF